MKKGLVKELERLDDGDIQDLRNSFETIERILQKIAEAHK